MANKEWDLSRSGGALSRIDDLKAKKAKAQEAGDSEYVTYYENEMKKVYSAIESEDFEWDEEDFTRNKPVLNAFKSFWEAKNDKAWEGSEEDLASEYKSTMGWFDYNLPYMSKIALDAQGWSDEELKNFGTMMDGYDKLDLGAGSTTRNVGRVLADPSSWIGLGTLGAGTAVVQGAKLAARAGIKKLINSRTKRLVTAGALEGGAYTVADDALRQEVENPDAEYDVGRGITAGVKGAATGGLLGGGVGKLAKGARNKKGLQDAEDIAEDLAYQQKINKLAEKMRTEDLVRKSVDDKINAGTDWLGDQARKGGLIGNIAGNIQNQTRAPLTKESLTKGLVDIGGLELKKRSGAKMFGAGMAPQAQQAKKNDLIKGALSSIFKLKTGYGAAKGISKAVKGLKRNVLSPLVARDARRLNKSDQPIPKQIGQEGVDRAANLLNEFNVQGKAAGLDVKHPFGPAGASGAANRFLHTAGNIEDIVQSGVKPKDIADAAPIQKTVPRPPIKGQKVAGSTSQAKEAQALKAKETTAKKEISKDLTTIQKNNLKEGDVAIRDPKTGKFILCKKGGQ